MKGNKKETPTPQDLDIYGWQTALNKYRTICKEDAPPICMRIENTPFTAARYSGGMKFNKRSYKYFEPKIPNHSPNPDGTPYVAWLMVRDDFLEWVTKELPNQPRANEQVETIQPELF